MRVPCDQLNTVSLKQRRQTETGRLNQFYAGEVYVLNDGGEVDLDLGNYERYLDVTLSRDNNITTGKIYMEVIEKEVSRRNTHSRWVSRCLSLNSSVKESTWVKPSRLA